MISWIIETLTNYRIRRDVRRGVPPVVAMMNNMRKANKELNHHWFDEVYPGPKELEIIGYSMEDNSPIYFDHRNKKVVRNGD